MTERQTREVDEDLSNQMGRARGLWEGAFEEDEEDEETWADGEVVVFQKSKAKKGAEKPQT
ncbi:hypothetical protein TGAMA5MH_05946 [Trichoderma gamsii]|uniref:Uncharacterized protein n=1 Tax=Trichoderma gamsii TaxID=398673 RepID=A0A2K0T9R3_9HYPO|nr:hypothetical protein TGAMA5MH_05946 [Trichoderma gamsii]